jgi:hypothetical protein
MRHLENWRLLSALFRSLHQISSSCSRDRLEITIHTHFKTPPLIEQVWIGHLRPLPADLVPADLREGDQLFFHSLDGQPLEVCKRVGGSFQVYDLPRTITPREVRLGKPFEQGRSRHGMVALYTQSFQATISS